MRHRLFKVEYHVTMMFSRRMHKTKTLEQNTMYQIRFQVEYIYQRPFQVEYMKQRLIPKD